MFTPGISYVSLVFNQFLTIFDYFSFKGKQFVALMFLNIIKICGQLLMDSLHLRDKFVRPECQQEIYAFDIQKVLTNSLQMVEVLNQILVQNAEYVSKLKCPK